jgi:hypothetical protein
MSHAGLRKNGLLDRFIIRLLDVVERLAFLVLPRGQLRRHLLESVDRTLRHMHRGRCSKGQR